MDESAASGSEKGAVEQSVDGGAFEGSACVPLPRHVQVCGEELVTVPLLHASFRLLSKFLLSIKPSRRAGPLFCGLPGKS